VWINTTNAHHCFGATGVKQGLVEPSFGTSVVVPRTVARLYARFGKDTGRFHRRDDENAAREGRILLKSVGREAELSLEFGADGAAQVPRFKRINEHNYADDEEKDQECSDENAPSWQAKRDHGVKIVAYPPNLRHGRKSAPAPELCCSPIRSNRVDGGSLWPHKARVGS
jgi:hypothetical protein